MSEPIKNRYEFVVFFDVENGNPNGDPDAGYRHHSGNLPPFFRGLRQESSYMIATIIPHDYYNHPG